MRLASFFVFIAAICISSSAAARPGFQPAPDYSSPHPAVVRVVSPEWDGPAFGSGSLVEVNELFGIVVTNWHVVRGAAGQVGVLFPDGFRSAATVMRVDRDWDLAALVIWRPNVRPIPISSQIPRPGEMLTIAGYGGGSYRSVSGRCTMFLSPSSDVNLPDDLVELAAPAREGDSGGPILNSRGELAGVLLGSAFGKTTGSHCRRLSTFLGTVAVDFRQLTSREMLARREKTEQPPLASLSGVREFAAAEQPREQPPVAAVPAERPASPPPVSEPPAMPSVAMQPAAPTSDEVARSGQPLVSRATPTAAVPAPSQQTFTDTIKTILAAIGLIAVVYCSLRLLGRAVG